MGIMFSKMSIRANVTQLFNIFAPYRETENHSILHMCLKPYYSRRKGIHAYIRPTTISGYYESGEENRNGHLQQVKSWFFLSAKECEDSVKVKCVVFPEPMMLLANLSVIVGCLLRFLLGPSGGTALELLIGGGIAVFFLVYQLRELETLKKILTDLLTQLSEEE